MFRIIVLLGAVFVLFSAGCSQASMGDAPDDEEPIDFGTHQAKGGTKGPPMKNVPPTVSLAAPSDGASFVSPADVPIAAVATDSDGWVTRVDFFAGTTKLGQDFDAPYEFLWIGATRGAYSITAVAIDNAGGAATSLAVNITVEPEPQPDAGIDADVDAAPDAGIDAEADAAPDVGIDAEPEAAPDAGIDAEADAAPDAGIDAEPDAMPEVGMDVEEPDASEPDAELDAATDAEAEAGQDAAADGEPPASVECDPDFPLTGLELYVDANNGGQADGSAARPFRSIGSAIAASTTGSVIHVARGTYAESVKVRAGINLMLLGGYAGGSAESYQSGLPGDFSDRSPAIHVTRIQGDGIADGISAVDVRRLVVDGFWISGASHGVYSRYDWTISVRPQLFVCSNVLEDNGQASGSHRGAGIYARDAYLTALSNVIRNNVSGRGAALSFVGPQATIASNTIESNIAYGDHGGGIQIAGVALIKNNTIRNNEVGRGLTYGWGGGLIIFNGGTNVQVTGNMIAGNIAPSIGGGIFVDDRAVATLDHNLVIRNQTRVYYKGGAGIYVDGLSGQGSTVTIESCTVAYNTGHATSFGNGVYVEGASSATITNSIFWGNGNDDFFSAAERTSDTSSIAVSYTLSAEAVAGSSGGIIAGAGNVSVDPQFASGANDDYHLRSRGGRWVAETWVVDAEHSPAIDSGNPASPFELEPLPNGGRINMGAYGNTPQASKAQ